MKRFLEHLGVHRARGDGGMSHRMIVRGALADLGHGIVGLLTLGRFTTSWSVQASQRNLDEIYGGRS